MCVTVAGWVQRVYSSTGHLHTYTELFNQIHHLQNLMLYMMWSYVTYHKQQTICHRKCTGPSVFNKGQNKF